MVQHEQVWAGVQLMAARIASSLARNKEGIGLMTVPGEARLGRDTVV